MDNEEQIVPGHVGPSAFGGMPASVKVGYRTYRIELWSEQQAQDEDSDGECDHDAGVIRLDPLMDAQKAGNTLLHEIIHAVWYVWSMPEENIAEEFAVDALTNGLATVMRDNPGLFGWMESALRMARED